MFELSFREGGGYSPRRRADRSAGMSLYRSDVPKDFKRAGISHVRIRVKDEATAGLLALLERQVSDCLEAGLIPIIAY